MGIMYIAESNNGELTQHRTEYSEALKEYVKFMNSPESKTGALKKRTGNVWRTISTFDKTLA